MLEVKKTQLPEGWTSLGDQYQFQVDVDPAGGESGWISSSEEREYSGTLKKRLAADSFRGKRIRLTGLCRSANTSQSAGLLLRVEDQNGKYIAHDNMWDRPHIGTTDWQKSALVLDVPPDAGSIWIGAHIRGRGQVWFKELVVEVVSGEVPRTDQYAFGCVGKWDLEPINLDFTQNELPELREGRPYISEARRWVISWGQDTSAYEFIRNSDVLFDGKPAAHVRPVSIPTEGYLYQHFAAARFRNKRVRFSTFIKTTSAEKGAWLRVYAFDFDGNDLVWKYSDHGVTGTTDWTKLQIEFDVPREAYVIDIGADISGAGEMYLGGLEFEVIGEAQSEHCELLPGISFYNPVNDGWILERANHVLSLPGLPGRGIELQPVGPGPQMKSSAGVRLSHILVNRELTFSCLLRGSRCGQKAKVYVHAFDSEYKILMESISHVSLAHEDWMSFESKFVLPKDTVRLHIWIVSFAAQSAYITQPSLRSGQPSIPKQYNTDYSTPPEPTATKVIEAKYKATARAIKLGDEGTVTFPIPGPYRNQVPLSFTLQTKPKAALLGYEIKKRDDGINWIAEVRVKPPEKGVIISWESLVLIRGEAETTLPQTSPEAPPPAAPWLRSTKCVQSEDDEIKKKATELASKSKGLESYIRNVIDFTSKNRGKKGNKFNSLDAKTAIGAGGSCTSRANLAAALLRANNIPARTVSHLPSWMRSYFFEHWLVEYWHPGVGWVWVEPTMGRMQPAANELIVLAVSSPDDEDKCDDLVHLRYLMPGGAYLSGCELSKELEVAPIMKRVNGPNIAVEQAVIRGTDSDLDTLFQEALQNFDAVSEQRGYKDQLEERTETTLAAVHDGDAAKLTHCLRSMVSKRSGK